MRGVREAELRVRGLGLTARFVASTTSALTLVMAAAAVVLYLGVTNIVESVGRDTVARAVILNADQPEWQQEGKTGASHPSGVEIFPVRYGTPPRPGELYLHRDLDESGRKRETRFLVPDTSGVAGDLLGMIVGILLMVVLVGAGVALWAGRQVSRPIHRIIEDVRQIAKGDLAHKTRAVGGGEIELLARSIDRMTHDLDEAQDAQLELSIREREMDLAAGVREALLPLATPWVPGYDLGAAHLGAGHIAGDFHDFVEVGDGRVGLLVCDVSGKGVPAALVGATARSYLRSELARGGDVGEALRKVNRWLQQDVRRGMFVTALYALISPAERQAAVACAGHKIPLLRYTAADGKLRVVHPEGIALGFDKGPVFDRRLEVQTIPIELGDRLFLCNSAPLSLVDGEGRELGEKAFYRRVLAHASLDTPTFLRSLRRDLEQFLGQERVPADISLVTIARTD